jgi:hypothetical protein
MKISDGALAILVLLGGCAAPQIGEHSKALDRTAVCCSTYAEVQMATLTGGTESRTEVSLNSPAFVFPEGKSFFLAYRLPQSKATSRKLTIRTFAVNTVNINAAHVFVPRVTTLDAKLKPVRSVAPALARHRPRIIGESWWQGEITLDPSEEYALLHTGVVERAARLQTPDSDAGAVYAPTSGGGGVLIPNARGYRIIPGGPTGELAILFTDG